MRSAHTMRTVIGLDGNSEIETMCLCNGHTIKNISVDVNFLYRIQIEFHSCVYQVCALFAVLQIKSCLFCEHSNEHNIELEKQWPNKIKSVTKFTRCSIQLGRSKKFGAMESHRVENT